MQSHGYQIVTDFSLISHLTEDRVNWIGFVTICDIAENKKSSVKGRLLVKQRATAGGFIWLTVTIDERFVKKYLDDSKQSHYGGIDSGCGAGVEAVMYCYGLAPTEKGQSNQSHLGMTGQTTHQGFWPMKVVRLLDQGKDPGTSTTLTSNFNQTHTWVCPYYNLHFPLRNPQQLWTVLFLPMSVNPSR